MAATTGPAGTIELDGRTGKQMLVATVAGAAVVQLTGSVVNLAMPSLARDLGASSAEQQWVLNGYLLTVASLILVGGSLGDRFGRVRVYRIGVVGFSVASVLCAVAPTASLLIGARMLQGVAGAVLTPGSLAIIESTLTPDDRGRGVGRWSGLSGVAAAAGPLVGGLLVDVSWRLVFLIGLPLAVVAFVVGRRIPESRDGRAAGHPIDVVGALLAAVLLGSLSLALVAGGVVLIPGVVVAGVAAVVLWRWERGRSSPMVPIDLFSIRPFLAANTVTLLVYGGMGVTFFLLSVYLQVGLGWSPLAAGATMLPITVMMLALSSRAGEWAQRIGPRRPLTVGPLVMAGGILLLSTVQPGDTYLTGVLPGIVVFGAGLALSVAPVTATALGSVPDSRSGAASGLNNAVSQVGQLLAVAAIPVAAGLTGDSLSRADELAGGFGPALRIAAVVVAAGGVAAAVLLRGCDEPQAAVGHRYHCGVDAPGAAPLAAADALAASSRRGTETDT